MEFIIALAIVAILMVLISGNSNDRDRMPPRHRHRRRPVVFYDDEDDTEEYYRWYHNHQRQVNYNAALHTLMFVVLLALALLFGQNGCNDAQTPKVQKKIEKIY